jgi:hypothetical protein
MLFINAQILQNTRKTIKKTESVFMEIKRESLKNMSYFDHKKEIILAQNKSIFS